MVVQQSIYKQRIVATDDNLQVIDIPIYICYQPIIPQTKNKV